MGVGVDWDDLRSFLAIAREGTLSAAARRLGVQQSTMGRRLAALEAKAGVRLLERTPHGFRLTSAGEAARTEVERMEDAAQAAERAVSGRDARLEGIVRLTTVSDFASGILMQALADLAQRYPGILVELITDDRTLSLAAREADLAIRLARPKGQLLLGRRIGEVSFGIYASAAYLAERDAQALPGGDGVGHRLILTRDENGSYPEIDALAAMAPRAEVALRTDSRASQLAAALAGLGVVVLGHHVAVDTDLVRLDAPPLPAREIWLVQHEDTRNVPRIRAVAEALANRMRAAAPLFLGQE
ncbi:transcriptional regulator, LysR family [Acidocella aminolytica 101 = DSM 11237]|uniref:Transcriptional regulator LysR n=2 Tax=Acidocella TaxID=50709 RepID=A0A0D6PJK9_9PROT|nr:transcriptional regulator LysR [Acidocella aminolytica 101 = DSM 11237]SHE30533.1 transcriptional regulator, LysR family [Acidocella aminolytica 101 = DSM 11237]